MPPLAVDGDYTLTYRAYDAAGHVGLSDPVRLVVDTVARLLPGGPHGLD